MPSGFFTDASSLLLQHQLRWSRYKTQPKRVSSSTERSRARSGASACLKGATTAQLLLHAQINRTNERVFFLKELLLAFTKHPDSFSPGPKARSRGAGQTLSDGLFTFYRHGFTSRLFALPPHQGCIHSRAAALRAKNSA